MDRRAFLAAGTAALAAPVTGLAGVCRGLRARPSGPAGSGPNSACRTTPPDDFLQMYSAFGVDHVCSSLPSRRLDEKCRWRDSAGSGERVESFGLHLDMLRCR